VASPIMERKLLVRNIKFGLSFSPFSFLSVKFDSTRISGGSETGINQYPWMGMKVWKKLKLS
jgi:hypothetical protein